MGDNNGILPSGTTGIKTEEGKGMAITAFVFSLLGIIPLIGFLCIIVAIILGIIVLVKHKNGKGFAIAAIIIALVIIIFQVMIIAVLAIYFRPSELPVTASYSIVTAPFFISGQSITNDQISLELRNNGGENINFASADISLSKPRSIDCLPSSPVNMAPGEVVVHTVICSGIKSGDSVSGDIMIKYTSEDSVIEKTATGSISGKVA